MVYNLQNFLKLFTDLFFFLSFVFCLFLIPRKVVRRMSVGQKSIEFWKKHYNFVHLFFIFACKFNQNKFSE